MSKKPQDSIQQSLPYILFFLLCLVVLFLGFYRNQWEAARSKKFSTLDKSSEGFVMGRLVQSRQEGIFSKAGLLGMGDVDPSNMKEADSDYQYDTYFNGGTFSSYFIYRSQSGFQAALFSLLDSISPGTSRDHLRLFRGLTSLLAAATIGLFLTWIHLEFGLFPALVALSTTLLSQWLTLFGRNIFWGIWLYFLPFLAVAFLLRREGQDRPVSDLKFALVVFFPLFLKCLLSGYDFISTAAITACIPILYYAILKQWNWKRFLKRAVLAATGAAIAVVLSLAILAGQIGSLTGRYQDGFQHIVNSIGRRTYGDPKQYPIYAASLQARTSDVLLKYLKDGGIFLKFHLSFGELALLFLLFSGIFFLFLLWKKGRLEQRRKGTALIAATWLAFLGSISTYVIFKGASSIHTHLYYIVWHLPFTILGFAMCAFVLQAILQSLFGHSMEHQTDLSTT